MGVRYFAPGAARLFPAYRPDAHHTLERIGAFVGQEQERPVEAETAPSHGGRRQDDPEQAVEVQGGAHGGADIVEDGELLRPVARLDGQVLHAFIHGCILDRHRGAACDSGQELEVIFGEGLASLLVVERNDADHPVPEKERDADDGGRSDPATIGKIRVSRGVLDQERFFPPGDPIRYDAAEPRIHLRNRVAHDAVGREGFMVHDLRQIHEPDGAALGAERLRAVLGNERQKRIEVERGSERHADLVNGGERRQAVLDVLEHLRVLDHPADLIGRGGEQRDVR